MKTQKLQRHCDASLQRRGVKSGPKLYNKILNRSTVARIVITAKNEACGLNYHLHSISATGTPYCDCDKGKEEVERCLLECCKYNEQRKNLRKVITRSTMHTETHNGIYHTHKEIRNMRGKENGLNGGRKLDNRRDQNQKRKNTIKIL